MHWSTFARPEILAPFFLLVGLQLRAELTHIRQIALPSFAAIGGSRRCSAITEVATAESGNSIDCDRQLSALAYLYSRQLCPAIVWPQFGMEFTLCPLYRPRALHWKALGYLALCADRLTIAENIWRAHYFSW